MGNILVRHARAEDKPTVLAFCQQTFSWGDYIDSAWDNWLKSTDGQLFVATIDEQPVGIVYPGLIENDVVWMSGMRVDPNFRRHGIASALDQTARDYGRAHNCRVARLATSIKNLPAQTLLEQVGYQRVAKFNEWEADAAPNDFAHWRVAQKHDMAAILDSWENSEIRIAGHSLAPDRHWRWREIDSARLRAHIDANEIRMNTQGWSMAVARENGDWNGLLIHALVGDEQTTCQFAVAARGEASYRGYKYVEALLPDLPLVNSAMTRAEYKTDSGMLIYEYLL